MWSFWALGVGRWAFALTRAYPDRPVTGVGAVIVAGGKIVLVKRAHAPLEGEWSLPGGVVEVGETLEAAVAREVLEETGLVVDVGPVIDVFDRIMLDAADAVQYHFVLVDYLCRPRGGALVHGSDASDVALVDPRDLGRFHLNEKALEMIGKGLELAREELS